MDKLHQGVTIFEAGAILRQEFFLECASGRRLKAHEGKLVAHVFADGRGVLATLRVGGYVRGQQLSEVGCQPGGCAAAAADGGAHGGSRGGGGGGAVRGAD